MRAAIYCRLSKEDQDAQKRGRESESIQNQKSMLIQYAVQHGLEIYQIYCDEDYSGVDRNRPDFNRMIEAASQKKFQVILAKTQSRFTRDMELVEQYLHGKFLEWGIRFIAVVDHVDTEDLAGKKSRQINGLINQWYLEDLSNNVRLVLDHKRKKGEYIAAFALYGYQKDPQNHNRIVIDPPAAQVVKRIFSLYLEGNGTTKIAHILNQEGIACPTRYKQQNGFGYKQAASTQTAWSKATIYRILTTQTYAGDMEQGRHKKISYKSPKTVWLPKKDWIVVPDTNEPIIDREMFDRVQQMLAQRARGGKSGTVNPFAGKVFCGLCGCAMEQTGSGANNAMRYFRCRMSQRDKSRCPGQTYIPMTALKQLVTERIRQHSSTFFQPETVDMTPFEQQMEGKHSNRQNELERLEHEVQRRTTAMQELYLDKSSGLLGLEEFRQLNEAYQRQIQQYHRQIRTIRQEMADEEPMELQRQRMMQQIQEQIGGKTLTRELVCLLIDKIVVYPVADGTRTIQIQWRF